MAAKREIGEMSRSRAGALMGALFTISVLGWQLPERVERRLGVPAWIVVGVVVVGGVLLVLSVVRLAGWVRPILGDEARRQAAERSLAGDRRVRPWLICTTLLAFLPLAGSLLGALGGYPPVGGDWGDAVILCSLVTSNMAFILPSRGETFGEADARDRVLRGEAMRVGYLVLLALGMAVAAVAGRWPAVGAQCVGPAVLASVLVAQVQMMFLTWQPVAPAASEAA